MLLRFKSVYNLDSSFQNQIQHAHILCFRLGQVVHRLMSHSRLCNRYKHTLLNIDMLGKARNYGFDACPSWQPLKFLVLLEKVQKLVPGLALLHSDSC